MVQCSVGTPSQQPFGFPTDRPGARSPASAARTVSTSAHPAGRALAPVCGTWNRCCSISLHRSQGGSILYWRRSLDTPYLVDHAFVPRDWLPRIERFDIGLAQDWLELSDHMPLVLDLSR